MIGFKRWANQWINGDTQLWFKSVQDCYTGLYVRIESVGFASLQVPQIGLWQKANIKQVSAINSEITKSVRHSRVLKIIKWEKSQLRGHEKQNQCANRNSPLCPSIFNRGSHNVYRQGATHCPHFSVGPSFTAKK